MSNKIRHWAQCKDVTFKFRSNGGVRIEIDSAFSDLFMVRELNAEQWAAVLLEDSIAKRAYEQERAVAGE